KTARTDFSRSIRPGMGRSKPPAARASTSTSGPEVSQGRLTTCAAWWVPAKRLTLLVLRRTYRYAVHGTGRRLICLPDDDDEVLVQATVKRSAREWLAKTARGEGLSSSAYLRRIIYMVMAKSGSGVPGG